MTFKIFILGSDYVKHSFSLVYSFYTCGDYSYGCWWSYCSDYLIERARSDKFDPSCSVSCTYDLSSLASVWLELLPSELFFKIYDFFSIWNFYNFDTSYFPVVYYFCVLFWWSYYEFLDYSECSSESVYFLVSLSVYCGS